MGIGRLTANPPDVPAPVGMYSHLVRVEAGELLFLAGQVAVDGEGNTIGKGDAGAQTRAAYLHIGRILASAGASYEDIVQVRTYLVGRENLQPYLDARKALFEEIYPDGAFPPNTLVFVEGLFEQDMLVEIEIVAAIPN